jgi:hypothetical protein
MRLKLNTDHDHPAPPPSAGTRFYDMVFVSSSDSTRASDEYFAFFDRRSGRFRGCNFTVIAAGMKTPQWCSWFDDYQVAGGLEIPRQQTWYRLATDNLPDMSADHSGILRVYRKLDLELNPVLPDSLFGFPGR